MQNRSSRPPTAHFLPSFHTTKPLTTSSTFALSLGVGYARTLIKIMQSIPTMTISTITLIVAIISLSSCATERLVRVEGERLIQPYKGVKKQEFIGFAGDGAYAVVTFTPWFPWSNPKEAIWWCRIYDLSPSQFETLKSRIKVLKTHPTLHPTLQPGWEQQYNEAR